MTVFLRLAGLAALMILASVTAARTALGQGPQAEISLSAPVDVERMLSFLLDSVDVSYADQTYSQTSGRTRLDDVKVTFDGDDRLGFAIDELVVAGFAADALEARMQGSNFEQSAVLLRYLEARNVALFGMEQFYGPLTDAYLGAVDDLTEQALGEPVPDVSQSLEELDFQIGRITIEDFQLLPFFLPEKSEPVAAEDKDAAEAVSALQRFAAFSRAMGAESLSMEDVSVVFEMLQDGEKLGITMSLPLSEVEGWQGGDYVRSYAENISYLFVGPNEEADEDFPLKQIEISGKIGSYLVENVRLDKALAWLARGEMPPTTETDLMSLGTWTVKDQTISLFDAPFYSIVSSETDLSQFRWFIPTKIQQQTQGLVFDMGSFVETITSVAPALKNDPEVASMFDILAVLDDYDLAAPSMDMDFNWLWEPDAGPASLTLQTGLDGYGTMEFDLSGLLGRFNDWVDLSETSESLGGEQRFSDYVTDTVAFTNISLTMNDRGGNDRVFELLAALAEALEDTNPNSSAITGYTPKELKQLVSGGIMSMSGLIGIPELRGPAQSLAQYVSEGGTFDMALRPSKPVRLHVLDRLSKLDGPQDMWTFFEQLGLQISHTPAYTE